MLFIVYSYCFLLCWRIQTSLVPKNDRALKPCSKLFPICFLRNFNNLSPIPPSSFDFPIDQLEKGYWERLISLPFNPYSSSSLSFDPNHVKRSRQTFLLTITRFFRVDYWCNVSLTLNSEGQQRPNSGKVYGMGRFPYPSNSADS